MTCGEHESDRCVSLLCMSCSLVMQAHMSLCEFWQMQLVAEYDYKSEVGARHPACISCKHHKVYATQARFFIPAIDRQDLHLIHHVIKMAVGAACDNLDCIGSVICLACCLHHSSKCPAAKQCSSASVSEPVTTNSLCARCCI